MERLRSGAKAVVRYHTGAGDSAVTGDGAEASVEDAVDPSTAALADELQTNNLRLSSLNALIRTTDTVNYLMPTAVILYQGTRGYRTPLPLGKFGQPFFAGWQWEVVNPRRLFRSTSSGLQYTVSDQIFQSLAHEAYTLPFACRSRIQRFVVAWALRNRILPIPSWQSEPDVLLECKFNPGRLPLAIRRSHSSNKVTKKLYTEWDILDLDCYIVYRMSRPSKRQRDGGLNWPQVIQQALVHARDFQLELPQEESVFCNGPRQYEGSGEPLHVLQHLRSSGVSAERLLDPDSDFVTFMMRMKEYDDRRCSLDLEYDELMRRGGQQVRQDPRRTWVDAQIHIERVPEGHPVLRVAAVLQDGDRIAVGEDGIVRGVVTNCT